MVDQVITKQELIDAQKDAQTLEDVVNGPSGELIETRLGRQVYTLASIPIINAVNRDEINGLLAPKANSIDVYQKTETYTKLEVDAATYKKTEVFTKSEVTSLVTPKADKTYVDSAVGAISTDGSKQYATLALANADISSIALNKNVFVSEEANGGYWYKATAGATTLTKSPYDPLTQAKAYATTKANTAEANAISYVDSKTLLAESNVASLTDVNKTFNAKTLANYYLGGGDKKLSLNVNATVAYIDVIEGTDLYIKNGLVADNIATFAFFANDVAIDKAQIGLADNRYKRVETDTGDTYWKVTVPLGAKQLVYTTKYYANNHTWSIKKKALFTANAARNTILLDVTASQSGELYQSDNILLDRQVGGSGVVGAAIGAQALNLKVRDGEVYYFWVEASIAFPFVVIFSSSTDYTSTEAQRVATAEIKPTIINNLYYVVVPSGLGVKSLFANIKVATLDLTATISVQQGGFSNQLKRKTGFSVSKLNGMGLVDEAARAHINELSASVAKSRLFNKNLYAFGDSITQGTEGGYLKYITAATGATISNFGSSGAGTARTVDIVTAGDGLPRRDSNTASQTMLAKDYTIASAVTIQIGTNEGNPIGGITDLPAGNITDYANPLDYWALFPEKFFTNIALCIEFIKSKNPSVEIYLITPPYTHRSTDSFSTTRLMTIASMLKTLGDYYSVPVINSIYESGVSFKEMKANYKYSYDGTHFNTLGNKMWGTYIGRKILSGS